MASSTDWKPSLNGKELDPIEAYDALVNEGYRPFLRTDPKWAAKAIEPQLTGVPNAAPAIQESILALWRLKQLEGDLEGADGEFESGWQCHVSAWLVSQWSFIGIGGKADCHDLQHRHRDLCLEAQAPPIQVVLDFVDGMVRTGNLPGALVPSWQGDTPVSTQEGGSKDRKSASAKTRGKVERLVLPVDVPLHTSRSPSGTSGGNPEAGGKRTRTATPDEEEGQSKKRPRGTKAAPLNRSPQIATISTKLAPSASEAPNKVARVSLGQYEFEEFDAVTEDLVPGIVGKVSRSGVLLTHSRTDRELLGLRQLQAVFSGGCLRSAVGVEGD